MTWTPDHSTMPTTEAEAGARIAIAGASAEKLERGALVNIAGRIQDLEQYAETPSDARGAITLHDADALAVYTNRHSGPGSVLFADLEGRTLAVVLNHHASAEHPGWGDHRATVTLRVTDAWAHWTGKDRQLLGQAEFAQHVEDGITELIDPTGAAMLEVAQSIEATTSGEFASAERLANGERRFTYRETIEARAGQAGHLVVPEVLTLGIPVLEGQTEAYRIEARFRYRIESGRLRMGYTLTRPRDVLRAAVRDEVTKVEEVTGLKALAGIAPAALR